MAEFERGFRNQCERISVGLREELELKPWEPLDMDLLAEHLDIEVLPIAFRIEDEDLEDLKTRDPSPAHRVGSTERKRPCRRKRKSESSSTTGPTLR